MTTTPNAVERARRWYAEELRFTAKVSSPAVIDAFATVPRERFVGPGPWRIKSPMSLAEYWTTGDADPRHVYHDVLIALDEDSLGLSSRKRHEQTSHFSARVPVPIQNPRLCGNSLRIGVILKCHFAPGHVNEAPAQGVPQFTARRC